MANNILSRFKPAVAGWFEDVFAEPTDVQTQAWDAISQANHALLVAPTGSGKTLAAFLWSLNNLMEREGQIALPLRDGDNAAGSTGRVSDSRGSERRVSEGGVKVLYISPLKALGVDIERNLRVPLAGIARVAQRLGVDEPDISIGIRSGDTPQSERNRQLRKPPDVLITTPESAYLMLTSKAAAILASVDTAPVRRARARPQSERNRQPRKPPDVLIPTPESAYLMLTSKAAGILASVDTVIIDEIRAIAGSKRGVHMALTMERLAQVAGE